MDALNALNTRASVARVTPTAPSEKIVQNLFRAALRAPDHGQLRPWRFLRIEGSALMRLSDLFVQAALHEQPTLSEEKQQEVRRKALRAPLVIVTISCPTEHPRIPELEQDIAAACACHAMLIAAHAQGLGAMWRTGSMATNPIVKTGLGLDSGEKILSFLYVGQPSAPPRPIRELPIEDFVKFW
jgi:nitroreductase